MNRSKLKNELYVAFLLALFGGLIFSASGFQWGSDEAGALVSFACMVYLMFLVVHRTP